MDKPRRRNSAMELEGNGAFRNEVGLTTTLRYNSTTLLGTPALFVSPVMPLKHVPMRRSVSIHVPAVEQCR